MQTAEYAELAEKFLSRLYKEEYLHLAGIKEEFETKQIFDEFSCLFSRDEVLRRLDSRKDRESSYLAEFAVHGHIEQRNRELTEQISNAESRAEVEWFGDHIPLHAACRRLMIEANPEVRHALEIAISKAIRQQNPVRLERVKSQKAIAEDIGFQNYLTLCEELSGQSLQNLGKEMALFLEETEEAYKRLAGKVFAEAGIKLEEATEADLRWIALAPSFDSLFPSEKLLPAARATLTELGIDLASQQNVHLDLEPRPKKHHRPFCCPITVPGEVWVVVSSRGGYFDYLAFFHELGHAEHFSHISPDLPMAYRLLGDKAICEGFAFAFQALAAERNWLERMLDLKNLPENILQAARLLDFSNARKCAAKLCFEIELHSHDACLEDLQSLYGDLLQKAYLAKVRKENFLFDLDDAYYCAVYLRAWALDMSVRCRLQEQFGKNWFSSAEAGRLLKQFWARGHELPVGDLAKELYPAQSADTIGQILFKRLQF